MANSINLSTSNSRQELIDDFSKLPVRTSPEEKFALKSKQSSPYKFSLDLKAIVAEQSKVTPALSATPESKSPSSSKTAATISTSSTSSTSSVSSTSSTSSTSLLQENNLRNKNRDGEEYVNEKSTSSPRIRKTSSPRKREIHPRSSSISSPAATKKQELVESQKNSPVTTPRDATETFKTPRSQRGSMRELRKKVSRKISDIDLSQITAPLKGAASAVKEALTPNTTPRKQSPREKAELVALIPIGDRNKLARKILELEESKDFQSNVSTIQTMLKHAVLLNELPEDSPLRSPEGLKVLLEEVNLRKRHHRVDIVLDLKDPAFSNFVKEAAEAAFVKPWEKDSSNVDSALKMYLSAVMPTFARDFANSTYQVRGLDGSLRTLQNIEEFITYVGGDDNQDLSMTVSNITSQNLSNFLKNTLFLRQDSNGVSQSMLKLYDGTPILPQALAKASYVLSKDKNDTLIVEYTWESSQAINGSKEIRARELGGNSSTFAIENPTLKITVRVDIEPNGKWTMENPHLQAEGWNQTPDR